MNADAWLAAVCGCLALAFIALGLRGVGLAWMAAAGAWLAVAL